MPNVLMNLSSTSLGVAQLYQGRVNAGRLVMQNGSAHERTRMANAVTDRKVLAVSTTDSPQPVSIESAPSGHVLCGITTFASGLGDVAIAIVSAKRDRFTAWDG